MADGTFGSIVGDDVPAHENFGGRERIPAMSRLQP
jgi:hypothetical protein